MHIGGFRTRVACRDFRLEIDDTRGLRGGAADPASVMTALTWRLYSFSQRGHFGALGQVVVAIGHAEPALQQYGVLRIGIVQPLRDEHLEQMPV